MPCCTGFTNQQCAPREHYLIVQTSTGGVGIVEKFVFGLSLTTQPNPPPLRTMGEIAGAGKAKKASPFFPFFEKYLCLSFCLSPDLLFQVGLNA
jgi:hypothetical protein